MDKYEPPKNIKYKYHHGAWVRGYVSRKYNDDGTMGYKEPYKGRFGTGYVWHMPTWNSTRYHYILYYIKVEC